MVTSQERLALARLSLEGLSVGDAFGDCFFMHADLAQTAIRKRAIPAPPWQFTDDTNMALSIYRVLADHGEIQQDVLAASFAKYYDAGRGYGPAMHRVLGRLGSGEDWRVVAKESFGGMGSYGNGAAMRVAPLGAYFADDLERVVDETRKSAEITHAHAEGIAGAIAVAVAAAQMVHLHGQETPKHSEFLESILPFVPDSEVKSRLRRVSDSQTTVVDHIIGMVGNGYQISAQDTVPFALWCVGQSMANFEEALWLTVSALGDIDTNCAIVGGIVALYTGHDGIPSDWLGHREPLPPWAFGE